MKLRAVLCAFGLTIVGGALTMNCGTEDGSTFNNGGNGEDGGGGTQPPGFGGDPNADGGGLSNSGCTKLTCADLKINCGPAGDGCGSFIESCGKCGGQETCGGGGTLSVCGGAAGCVPKTCAQLGIQCGPAGDGCGGTLDCQQCPSPQVCGGGGPSKCGGGQITDAGVPLLPDGGVCTGRSVCATGECGPVANGCGGLLQCGDPCTALGQTCGGGGVPSMCGAPTCTKTTCQAQNANCGFVADGCGGILNCGGPSACTVPGEICGGGGPNKCGAGVDGGGAGNCVNLCLDQPTNCTGPNTPNTTTITGVVYMPNGTLPVYDALVYVPNGTVDAVPTGNTGTCDSCSAQASGLPLVNTKTNYKGEFTLTNMPYRAAGVPLVIQAGRWRKQITVFPTRCGTVNLSPAYPQPTAANNTTFGTTHSATNNIPKFAVTSGGADALQCLLRKIGIADSEFTQPIGAGRVNVYTGVGGTNRYRDTFNGLTGTTAWAVGAQSTRNFPDETYLYGDNTATVDASKLNAYDAVVLTCTGTDDRISQWANYRAEMKAYADAGGKIFASHWHHSWLEYGAAPWGTTGTPLATFPSSPGHLPDLVDPLTATINTGFAKGSALADWLVHANTLASTTGSPRGQISIIDAQHTVSAVDTTRVTNWISVAAPITEEGGGSTTNVPSIQHFDFNTPVGQATQCGRFVISDLHVSRDAVGNGSGGGASGFPNNCTSTGMTDQERVLAFMIFDLTSCIQPIVPPTPTCTAMTCAQQGIECGFAGNGCGAQITCPQCPNGQVCQGSPAKCVVPPCTAKTCPMAGAQCGLIANGCGGTVDCGPCTVPGQICGGSGANQCGSNTCNPTTCVAQNIQCGPAGNGCGGLLDCGPCPPGQTCGGGGQAGICGAPNCNKRTCAQANANCGFIADGCGGLLDCGPCPVGQSCGGGGVPNQCGGGSVPK
jgi:hypothetical protein